MYNRYIPQSDGSFRRNRMPEQVNEPPKQEPPRRDVAPPACDPEPEAVPCRSAPSCPPPKNPPRQQRQNMPQRRQQPEPPQRDSSAFSFLRQLLPKDLDTGDLLIIVLLLLMAGDCQEDKNTMLLTLALYLFM